MSPWRQIQKGNFTSIVKLTAFLELDDEKKQKLLHIPAFSLNLPVRLAEKIEKNNIDDPIFRQFVPLIEETLSVPSFIPDPVKDHTFKKTPKLLHKYEGRALLLTTSACAMHCRYCFRQNFPYEKEYKGYEKELLEIEKDDSLHELILSGGDPLSLSNANFSELISDCEKIPHLKRLRIHSRFPIGIPERIEDEFLEILKKSRLQIWFVIHCNHPRELDQDVISAVKKIQNCGIPVLNQSVLLKGVNDTSNTLQQLSMKLVDNGIFPYYLHQLDRVEGAAHFEVAEEKGLNLIENLKATLSGYAVPKYVKEIPGKLSKIAI